MSFAKGHVIVFFNLIWYLYNDLFEMVHMWTDAEVRCANTGGWSKTSNIKLFKCFAIMKQS